MRVTRWLVVLLLAATGCGPLYGGKGDPMKGPPKKTPPDGQGGDLVPVAWDEECEVNFHEKLAIQPNVNAGRTLSESASATLVSAEREDDKKRIPMTIEAIEKFKQALVKDPFSAEATYGLAIAYTKVYRKGCTLKLLKRLSDLRANSKYAPDASRMIDAASEQNAFKPFKKDAQQALGI